MKELKQYPITRHGLDALSNDDANLLDKARTVVMWYLDHKYGKTNDKMTIALQEAAQWTGFILSKDGALLNRPKKFYTELYTKFKTAIENVPIDEHDEMGIIDETLVVANIMLKYKYIMMLKRKKKGLIEIVSEFFSSVV